MKEIIKHLEIIEKLLGRFAVANLNTAKDRIIALAKIGMPPTDISSALGESQNYVNVTLSNARKSGEL